MSLNVLHSGLSNACVIFSLIICGYGLWSFFRNQGVTPQYLGILIVGELLFLAQIVLGLVLWAGGASAARGWVHYLYGVMLVIALPGLYLYVGGRATRREALMYALMGLFLAGLALRGLTTATVGLAY